MGKYKVEVHVYSAEVLSWLEECARTYECDPSVSLRLVQTPDGVWWLSMRGTCIFPSKGVLEPWELTVEKRVHARMKDKVGDQLLSLVANLYMECERHGQTKFWLRGR